MIVLNPDCSTIPVADQLVVPLAVPPPPRSLDHITLTTPTLSEAVPETFTVPVLVLYVCPLATGEVMAMDGRMVSDGVEFTVRLTVLVVFPLLFVVFVKVIVP